MSGSAAKAAKRTAKGGKYSEKRRQRMLTSIRSVEKRRRKKARRFSARPASRKVM
jgi:hypothetical protein